MHTEDSDVVVIGGGPAGTSAASFLAKNKRNVILLEKEHFPRHHIGESTLLGLTNLLEREIGVGMKIHSAGFRVKTGGSYIWGKDRTPWSFHFRELFNKDRIAYQVERAKFDYILLHHSAALGVDVREESHVTHVLFEDGIAKGVRYTDKNSEQHIISCKFVIDASGLSSLIGKQLNLRRQYEKIRNVAIYGYWKAESLPYEELGGDIKQEDNSNILVVSCERYWIWLIPLAEQRVSVGIVFNINDIDLLHDKGYSDFYQNRIYRCQEVSRMLRNAKFIADEPLRTIQDWSQVCEKVAGPGYFITGDAAAFVDPILSSGTTLAVTFGIAAGRSVNTLLEFDDAKTWVYNWYQNAYQAAYNDFRRMADFWYLGSGRKEDWFHIAHEQVRQSLRVELNRRQAFVHIASGTFTTGEFSDRECYVDTKQFPIMIYFSPAANMAFFDAGDRRHIQAHLTEFPIEITRPVFDLDDKLLDVKSSRLYDDNDKPKLHSDSRIGVYSNTGEKFLKLCIYLSHPQRQMIKGTFLSINPEELDFFKMLRGNLSIIEIAKALNIDKELIKQIMMKLSKVGLLDD